MQLNFQTNSDWLSCLHTEDYWFTSNLSGSRCSLGSCPSSSDRACGFGDAFVSVLGDGWRCVALSLSLLCLMNSEKVGRGHADPGNWLPTLSTFPLEVAVWLALGRVLFLCVSSDDGHREGRLNLPCSSDSFQRDGRLLCYRMSLVVLLYFCSPLSECVHHWLLLSSSLHLTA